MKRILLRLLNPVFFVTLVVLAVAAQTSIFSTYPLMYLQPDFVLIAVLWCALRRSFTEGGILTLLFGDLAEIHSSSPSGVFLIAYMTVFLLTRAARKYLVLTQFSSVILLTLAGSVLVKLTSWIVLALLGIADSQWRHLLALLLPGAVMAGVAGVWTYRFLERFDLWTFKDRRAERRLDEESEFETFRLEEWS